MQTFIDSKAIAMDLDLAFRLTSPTHFMRAETGQQYPQSSRPEIILSVLELLELSEATSVYEIGTGSGFSTAVISRALGTSGHVYSVDADREVIPRARRLLSADGRMNVELHIADGETHEPSAQTFDRLVAWASCAAHIPQLWESLVHEGGVIAAPIATRRQVVKFRSTGRQLVEEGAVNATFIPLSSTPARPWEQQEQL